MRDRGLRSLHCARERKSREELQRSGGIGGERRNSDDRRAWRGRTEFRSRSVDRAPGTAMRLLPVRNDYGGQRIFGNESRAHGRAVCRSDHQYLPMRDTFAHSGRGAGFGGAEKRKGCPVMNRRKFLLGGATAAGALIVGYAVWPSGRLGKADLLAAKSGERFLANWIKLANDGTITVVVPHCDMGTGIYTSLSQMAADELDADWTKVRAETAPADPLFANSAMAEGFALEELNVPGDRIPTFLKGPTIGSMRIIAVYMDLQT